MKLIGRGEFTKAYLQDNGRVMLISNDPIKECMAFGWFPDCELFPKVTYVDSTDHGGYIYEMDYLGKPVGLKANLSVEEYEFYKTLQVIQRDLMGTKPHDYYFKLYELFSERLTGNKRDWMLEALDACSNVGSDIGFEVSPRNVRVSHGRLVLMDVFFKITGEHRRSHKVR